MKTLILSAFMILISATAQAKPNWNCGPHVVLSNMAWPDGSDGSEFVVCRRNVVLDNLVKPAARPVDKRKCPYDSRVGINTPVCSILHSRYLENHGGWQNANPLCTPGVDEECTNK